MNRLLFSSLEKVPDNFTMTNQLSSNSSSTKDMTCQSGFQYFQTSMNGQTQWGSDKPMKEVCPTNYKPHQGIPSHSLWNNLTKRKSMVTY